jgi:polygalacturonase
LSLLFALSVTVHAATTINVKDTGATGDGKTLDTAAIQKAIDQCTAGGGGTVTIPAGQYLVATVQLKDNVTLQLDDKAELLGTPQIDTYRNVDPFKDGLGADVGWALLVAVDAKHIAITGGGSLNGQGKEIAASNKFKGQGWGHRPFLVRIVRCDDVTLRGITLRDAGSWTTNLFQSDHVTIENVTINSHVAPHNDGIDIDSCQHVHISHCDIESGDDAICLKTTSTRPCVDVSADNCRLKTNQGAFKLGTESMADFRDIRLSNCQIRDTHNGGIKLLAVDGAHLQNVTVSDITMDNVRTPIFVRLGARLKTFRAGDAKQDVGTLEHVVIRNITAKAADKSQLMPPSGIYVIGIPDHRVSDLTLENITITLAGGGTKADARAKVDEKIDSYPEIDRFGKTLPAYGLYARHVQGLNVTGLTLKLDTPDLRPAIVCDDAADVHVSNCTISANADAESLVRLESVHGAELSKIGEAAGNLVRVEGATGDVRLDGSAVSARP